MFVVNLVRFCDLAEQNINTFCGIEFAHGDLAEGVQILKEGRNVLLGCDSILVAGLSLGFDAAILSSLNIVPEFVINILDSVYNSKLHEAQEAQNKLNERVWAITDHGRLDWLETMKNEFNKINADFQCGPWRKPTFLKRN